MHQNIAELCSVDLLSYEIHMKGLLSQSIIIHAN